MEANELATLIDTAVINGMPQDQLEAFLTRAYIPLPWQLRFHAHAREADKQGGPVDIGCGGARGPGKSHAVFAQVMLDDCMRVSNLKGLFLRQTGRAAQESFEDLIGKVLSGRMKYKYRGMPGSISFDNGSKVLLGGFRDERDIDNYIGIEYDVMAIEELNQLTENKVDKLKGSLRTSKEDWRPRMYTSFNPGGIGHLYVKTKYVTPHNERTETNTRFVPSTYRQNPYLNVEYLDYLKGLKGALGKAWRDGSFDMFEGQYFAEWNHDQHTIAPFAIPEGWKRYRAYDHGREAPACCKWYAVDYDGRVWVYRELYEAGLNVDALAVKIKKLSGDEHYQFSVADPSIFAHHGFVDKSGGQTIAETFARYGIIFMPASNRRVDGWSIMHQFLNWEEDKQAKMIYFNTCFDSIRTIPALIHDRLRPEDLDSSTEDHCFVGDTLVDTYLGKRRIKDLVGKEIYVMTTNGFNKCGSIRKTRKSEILKATFSNGIIIKATPDHRFLTTDGWKELKDLTRYDILIQLDICITSYLKLFKNLMVKDIIFAATIFKEMARGFTSLFGNTIMAKDRRAVMFIIETGIEKIMTCPILKRLVPLNICHCMPQPQRQKNNQEKIASNMQYQRQELGTNQKQAGNGIVTMRKNRQKNGNGLKSLVSSAARHLRRLNDLLSGQNTVTTVRIVNLQPCGSEEVYDLTVPEAGNFTINGGIVVHNCADADRYFLLALHEIKTPAEKTEVEKKLEAMKRQSEVRPENLGDFYRGNL